MATGKNDARNVSVGKPMASGGMFVAPLGTKLPTDASSPLSEEFVDVGFISEDGVTNSVETDSNDIKAWGGVTVLTAQSSRTETFQATLIETNETVLKQAYGDANVTGSLQAGSLKILHNGNTGDHHVVVFEILMTGNRVKRIVIPDCAMTELGDVVYNDSDPIGYETTNTAYPDAEGNTAYEYIAQISSAGSPVESHS